MPCTITRAHRGIERIVPGLAPVGWSTGDGSFGRGLRFMGRAIPCFAKTKKLIGLGCRVSPTTRNYNSWNGAAI